MHVSLIRYGAVMVKWTKSEFDEIERKTRKVMTLNKKLHLRSYVDRLHVSRIGRKKKTDRMQNVCEIRRIQDCILR